MNSVWIKTSCVAVVILGVLTGGISGQDSRPASPIRIALESKVPIGRDGLRWSPKAAKVALAARENGLDGTIELGPKGTLPVRVRLERTPNAQHFDNLKIDLDRNGKFSDTEKLATTPKETRGKWWSSFDSSLSIPVASDGTASIASTRPYPIALWYVEDPAEPNAEPALRWSRKGWHEGQVEIGGKPAFVLITEMEMDGVFDQRDAWSIARDRAATMSSSAQSMERHNWLDGSAYRVVAIDPHGRKIEIETFAPGFTEAEEKAKNDVLRPDREAPRAAAPLAFSKDPEAVFAAAKSERKRILVDFETTWCGPCATMNKIVYSAAAVVEAAKSTLPLKVDGDERRDLTKRFNVGAYPTIILLDADGNELRRVVGYQSVAQMAAFLVDQK